MTVRPVYHFYCDSPRCGFESYERYYTKATCMLPEGWERIRGKHYCPECAPMYRQPKFVNEEHRP